MRFQRAAVALFAILFPVLAGSAVPSVNRRGLSIEDLITLSRTGIEASVIQDRIRALGLDFEPGTAERKRLKEAGLDAGLLQWVLEWKPPAPEPSGPARSRETLRMFEEINPAGRRVLVLTNLDEAGEPIRDPRAVEDPAERPDAGDPPLPTLVPPLPRTTAAAPSAPEPTAGPVPRWEAAPFAPTGEAPSSAGPEAPPPVVVNVNVQAPPIYPGYFPYIIAGSPGGIYPTHLDFLGYGNNISKPSWFSGLGLNAANNFGHNTVAKPNNTGLDAFFGPPRP